MRPLSAVAAAMREGSTTGADISHRTGLSRSTVDAALEHLRSTGYITSSTDSCACDSCGLSGGCSTKSAGGACGAGRGLVTLTLTRRPGVD